MTRFEQAFADYGADYQTTLGRFMGSEAMYLRILDMLFQDENLANLGGALDRGDLTAAFECAHTLKGVAGNLGLEPLYQSVCAIVEPLRAGQDRDDYPALYRSIQTEYENAARFRRALQP